MKYLFAMVALTGLCGLARAEEKLDLHPVEKHMLSCVNAERARYGLPAFEIDPNLQNMARRHCAWMTTSRSMVHSNMSVAENIAMGQQDASAVTTTWMNSPGHRANILNGGHRYIGLCGYTASNGTVFWCQQFSGGPVLTAVAEAVRTTVNVATTPARYILRWWRR